MKTMQYLAIMLFTIYSDVKLTDLTQEERMENPHYRNFLCNYYGFLAKARFTMSCKRFNNDKPVLTGQLLEKFNLLTNNAIAQKLITELEKQKLAEQVLPLNKS